VLRRFVELTAQSGHPKTSAHLSAFEGEADMGRRIVPIISAAFDPKRTYARSNFAVQQVFRSCAMVCDRAGQRARGILFQGRLQVVEWSSIERRGD
jgi:hypothetical protein